MVGICHMHLRDRQIFKMEGGFQNPMAQTTGSEQKTVFHETLMTHMILMKVNQEL